MNKTHLITERYERLGNNGYYYYCACGAGSSNIENLYYIREEVTCKNCKSTHIFKNSTLSDQELQVIKEMFYNSTLINLEESALL